MRDVGSSNRKGDRAGYPASSTGISMNALDVSPLPLTSTKVCYKYSHEVILSGRGDTGHGEMNGTGVQDVRLKRNQ